MKASLARNPSASTATLGRGIEVQRETTCIILYRTSRTAKSPAGKTVTCAPSYSVAFSVMSLGHLAYQAYATHIFLIRRDGRV